jgi:hypothetical protein
MSEEKHHHFFHHHKKDEEQPTGEYGYSETVTAEVVTTGEDEYEKYKKEEKEHKHKQHLGEAGAIAAGAFALVRINKYNIYLARRRPRRSSTIDASICSLFVLTTSHSSSMDSFSSSV